MNRIIIGTFALLGPGAFCASSESPASPPQEGKASTGTAASLQSVTSGEVAGRDAGCRVVCSSPSGELMMIEKPSAEVKEGEYIVTMSKAGSGDAGKAADEFIVVSRKVQSPVISVEQAGEKTESGTQKSQSFRIREKSSGEVKGGLNITTEINPSAKENISTPRFYWTATKHGKEEAVFYLVNNGEGQRVLNSNLPLVSRQEPSITLAATEQSAASKEGTAVVQLALLLDTSSSMNGLINQARTYLWKIVNDMTLGRQNGKLPSIQIALYEYGNSGLSSSENWIRQVLPFTDDLDNVSKKLFELTTGGGTECCGAVIDRAVKDLKWNTDDPNALKMVFIAGNEPFNQGNVAYASAIARGLEKGITVNTIHCGSANNHDTKLWRDGARKGDGCFLNIDQNAAQPDPETPFDAELATLSSSLNRTYLAYGSRKAREEKMENQARQDELAQGLSFEASANRAEAKANKAAYRNTSWDMVDLYEQNGVKALGELNGKGELPSELEGKTEEEMEAVVKRKAAERADIQKKVRELTAQRSEWLNKWKEERKDAGKGREESLDEVMIQAVRKQASKKQFSFGGENGTQEKNSL